MAKSGMYGEMPKLIVGKYEISLMSDRENEPSVWIQSEDGEGSEFRMSELEKAIKEFFDKNF